MKTTTPTDGGIATDSLGIDGKPVKLPGSPSTSWVRPSGVPPDGAAKEVKMVTFDPTKRGKSKADKAYLKTRAVSPPMLWTSYGPCPP